jgi:hypothetical protein
MKAKTNKPEKTKRRTNIAPKSRRGMRDVKRRATPALSPAGVTGQSMIKQTYRERYENGSCGNALARKHLGASDGTVDLAKFQQLADRTASGLRATRRSTPG